MEKSDKDSHSGLGGGGGGQEQRHRLTWNQLSHYICQVLDVTEIFFKIRGSGCFDSNVS